MKLLPKFNSQGVGIKCPGWKKFEKIITGGTSIMHQTVLLGKKRAEKKRKQLNLGTRNCQKIFGSKQTLKHNI